MVLVENKTKKWGHSLGIIIPSKVVKRLGLTEGEELQVDIKLKKRIEGFGLFKGKKPFIRDERALDRDI